MNRGKKGLFVFVFFQQTLKKFPKLFYFFLFYFVVQIFLILIKLEVTPLFLYGMYSEKIPYTNIYKSTTLFINGRKLEDLNVSAREKEFLLTTMENYLIMKNNGGIDIVKTRVESRYSFLTNSGFYSLIKDKIYNHPDDISRFELWFKQRCTQLLKSPTISVEVLEKSYVFNKNTFSANLIKSKRVAFF